jgi:hypothetical protein
MYKMLDIGFKSMESDTISLRNMMGSRNPVKAGKALDGLWMFSRGWATFKELSTRCGFCCGKRIEEPV